MDQELHLHCAPSPPVKHYVVIVTTVMFFVICLSRPAGVSSVLLYGILSGTSYCTVFVIEMEHNYT